jgi:phenylacetate-CoA ligase
MPASRENVPLYYRSLDFEALWRDFPPAPDYLDTTYRLSQDEIRALQNARFRQQMRRAWEIPFYQRHWGKAGIAAGDIRTLDDLARLPAFSVHDMRASIAHRPPWGDLIGIDPDVDDPLPLILQTSGGTTGLPRAMIYAPRDREVMNINTGRRMYMQGVRPFDLVQVALATGLLNAGFLMRESIWKYTGAVPIVTGSGNQTSTRRQIELMKAWGVHYFAAVAPYARHVANVARDELKIDVRELKLKAVLSWLGTEDRKLLEEQWGTDVFDNYGTNEFGTVCCDCRHKTGMHVFEDSFVTEIVDPDTLLPKAPGEKGVLILTTLFKHAAPMIRFNTNDVLSFVPGACTCGGTSRRLSKVFGRADNMVKFRGTNVFPEAIGACLSEFEQSNGEYICVLERAAGGDTMTVLAEVSDPSVDRAGLETALMQRLRDALGVTLIIRAVDKGALASLTGISEATKIRRLLDKRKA